jgi:hypothetical protein
MIPDFIIVQGSPWALLPPGVHDTTLDEFFLRFVTNARRESLFDGLLNGMKSLFEAGCPQIFVDGSYVTAKPLPNDYEVCWDVRFVNPDLLDPIFFDLEDERDNQKVKFYGEYFPTIMTEGNSGKPFLEFFQTDRETGAKKGIIRIENYIKKGRKNDK